MEIERPPAEFSPAKTYREMAKLCYEQYVYLVTCATQNPQQYEPYPPDTDGEVTMELGPEAKLNRLESVLAYELRSALKNMVHNASRSLDQSELPMPTQLEFEELRLELDKTIQAAELGDISGPGQPWWHETGLPNPLRHPLAIIRITDTARWRKLPLSELLDGNQLHADLDIS